MVQVLPVIDLEPCESGEGARFLQSCHDPEDVQTLDHCRAFQMMIQPNSKHRHFGLVPSVVWDDEQAKQYAAYPMVMNCGIDSSPSMEGWDTGACGEPNCCNGSGALLMADRDTEVTGKRLPSAALPPRTEYGTGMPPRGDCWIGRTKGRPPLCVGRWIMYLIILALADLSLDRPTVLYHLPTTTWNVRLVGEFRGTLRSTHYTLVEAVMTEPCCLSH